MAAAKFRCLRCHEEKSNPADEFGAPILMQQLKEYEGVCIDCAEKVPVLHPAEAAMDELSTFANHIAMTFDMLDHLSENKYDAIEFGKIKPKVKPKVNEEKLNDS